MRSNKAVLMALLLVAAPLVSAQPSDTELCNNAADPTRRFQGCLRLAENGNALATYAVGLLYAKGQGVARDPARAMQWIVRAAEMGLALAMTTAGRAYQNADGVPRDITRAMHWYRRAATEHDDTEAQLALGSILAEGREVPSNPQEAVRWSARAADKGDRLAQYNLALAYHNGTGLAKDMAQAVAWYTRSAQAGYAQAQFNLGVVLAKGDAGVPQDVQAAVAWHQRAAAQKHSEAMFNLALTYEHGRGIRPDLDQAVRWYQAAAELNHLAAQVNLAALYHDGRGVPRDPQRAMALLQGASDAGDAMASRVMAQHYLSGDGVSVDRTRARQLMRKAAEAGDAHAQGDLAEMLILGWGGPADPTAARGWLERTVASYDAMKAGDEDYCKSGGCKTNALRSLALAYETGFGGPVNTERAKELYGRVPRGREIDSPLGRSARWLPDTSREHFTATSLVAQDPSRDSRLAAACGVTGGKAEALRATPQRQPLPRILEFAALADAGSGWNKPALRLQFEWAAKAFAECGVELRARAWWLDGENCETSRLDTALEPAISVAFTRSDPSDRDAAGRTIIGSRKVFVYWPEREVKGEWFERTLAHELGHVLGLRHPANFEPSLMQYGRLESPRFTTAQCETIIDHPFIAPAAPATPSMPGKAIASERHRALFESLRSRVSANVSLKALSLQVIAQEHGFSWREAARMLEVVRSWRPENPAPTATTPFDLSGEPALWFAPRVFEGELSAFLEEHIASLRSSLVYRDVTLTQLKNPERPPLNLGDKLTPEKLLLPVVKAGLSLRLEDAPGYVVGVWGNDGYLVDSDDGTVLGVRRNLLPLLEVPSSAALRAALQKAPEPAADADDGQAAPPPTRELRQANFGAPTPHSIPGGSVIKLRQMWHVLTSPAAAAPGGTPLVLAAINSPLGIPGALDLSFAAGQGAYNDATQRRLERLLAPLAARDRMLVTYCHGYECWLSYNLALRLAAAGYRNVHWLRGGLDAWLANGLPVGPVQIIER